MVFGTSLHLSFSLSKKMLTAGTNTYSLICIRTCFSPVYYPEISVTQLVFFQSRYHTNRLDHLFDNSKLPPDVLLIAWTRARTKQTVVRSRSQLSKHGSPISSYCSTRYDVYFYFKQITHNHQLSILFFKNMINTLQKGNIFYYQFHSGLALS